MKQTHYTCDWCGTAIGQDANNVLLRPAFPKKEEWPHELEMSEQLQRLNAMMQAYQEHRQRYGDLDICDSCYVALERWIEGWKREHP